MAAAATINEALVSGPVPPVQDDERLYRRILTGGWYKHGKPIVIPQKFFLPRAWKSDQQPGDVDGLSVNRANLTDVETAATRRDTDRKTHLAEFGVEDVRRLGLTVEPRPCPTDRSHAVIPELNSIDRRDPAKECQMEEWAMKLRDCAVLIYEAHEDS